MSLRSKGLHMFIMFMLCVGSFGDWSFEYFTSLIVSVSMTNGMLSNQVHSQLGGRF